jgi:NitT/TauT family transport system substrate-binding protein
MNLNPRIPAISRRSWGAAAGALALAPALAGLGACDELTDQPITIAAHVWVGYEPMFLARDKGWLDPKKVHLLQTASAFESVQALAQGKALGAAMTLDEMLTARATGMSLSLLLVFNSSLGADMLLVPAGVQKLSSIKGLRIGYEASSVGALMLAEVLQAAGLTQQDVQLVNIDVSQHMTAWQRQQADAFITYEPVATQLLELGMRRLFDSRQIPDTIIDVLAVRTDKLSTHHTRALQQLLVGHFRALDHLMRNPQDAAYRMATRLNLPASKVLAAYKGLVLPDAHNNYRLLAGQPSELSKTAQKLLVIMLKAGLLKKSDDLTDLVRADYLPTDNLLK